MEDSQTKPKTISNIKIEISLEEFFNINFYRHNEYKIVVSEERYNLLVKQEGFNELIHVTKFEVEGKNIYRLERLEDYKRSIIGKDEQRLEKEAEIGLARQKFQIIETWKKESRIKLMKTGKVSKEQIESLLIRCMNPETDRDKAFAEKLNYPYREENIQK